MDWKQLGFSTLAVYATMLIAGSVISLLSSQLQCSKIGVGTSFKQGSISAVFPAIVFFASAGFPRIRNPFVGTLQYFGLNEDTSPIVGVGYLVMLASWITTVWNIHNTEKAVCQPDVNEMSNFKSKLLRELQQKEAEKEKNAEKKQ